MVKVFGLVKLFGTVKPFEPVKLFGMMVAWAPLRDSVVVVAVQTASLELIEVAVLPVLKPVQ